MAIITYVDILVINLVGIRNHLAYTRPVARETSVHSENVDPLEPVEGDRRRLKKLWILLKYFYQRCHFNGLWAGTEYD